MTVYNPAPKPPVKVKQPRPLARKRMKRRPKSAATWARQYHSAEFRAFVVARPCAVCGVQGFSVAAHTKGIEKKGTGQKTSWRTLAPLCGPRPNSRLALRGLFEGCHEWYDNDASFRRQHGPKIRRAIAALQSAFRHQIEQRESKSGRGEQ